MSSVDARYRRPAPLAPDNLVPRPWGGRRLASWKGLAAGTEAIGECFEVAADPEDPEAGAHPSRLAGEGEASEPLPAWIAGAPAAVLGEAVHARWGARLPLLPKTLDVAGLLSVQAHPPGHPELYVVLDCDPGATLRLGFREPLDPGVWARRLTEGVALQRRLAPAVEALDAPLRDAVQRWLVGGPALPEHPALATARRELEALRSLCSDVLTTLHEHPLAPGDVILNARPGGNHAARDAAVHALGDAQGRHALILEIRRPGPTLRAWDHGRFPLRTVDPAGALAACGHEADPLERFRIHPAETGAPGVERLADCPAFTAWRLRPGSGAVHRHTEDRVRTLHAIEGTAELEWDGGRLVLPRGHSALLPAALGPWRVHGPDAVLVEATPGDG